MTDGYLWTHWRCVVIWSQMPANFKIDDETERDEFVRTHLGHRLSSLVSPICRPETKTLWSGQNDAYRAAKEGSYVMLRLFIEFLGVKGDENNSGKLSRNQGTWADDLRLSAFSHWGMKNFEPQDFGAEESFIAGVHRTLCKINAHFTYDISKPALYDRIASLPDADWSRAVDIIVRKLVDGFYSKLKPPIIVVHSDLEEEFKKTFTNLTICVRGDRLGRKWMLQIPSPSGVLERDL